MKQKNCNILKFIVIPIVFLNCGALVIISTSCTSYKHDVDNEQTRFIKQRSFSIAHKEDNYWVRGTGWILNKINDADDYSYYLATNYHVVIDKSGNDFPNTSWRYQDDDICSNSWSDYIDFKMFDIQPCYNSPSDTIDMRIVHVIFDNPHGQTKDKLDKLNTYYSVHGNILNTYYHGGELDKNSSLVYVAGYPVVTANKAHYQSEVVKGWYNHWLNPMDDSDFVNHAIDEHNTIIDRNDYYVFNNYTKSYNFMPGGASGSLCIDENFNMIGIFWGGFEASHNSSFYPALDFFTDNIIGWLSTYLPVSL